MEEPLYIVHWKSTLTGAEGHGDPLPREVAMAWVEQGNSRWPDITHWIEPEQEAATAAR
jgi:hypothetical protein